MGRRPSTQFGVEMAERLFAATPNLRGFCLSPPLASRPKSAGAKEEELTESQGLRRDLGEFRKVWRKDAKQTFSIPFQVFLRRLARFGRSRRLVDETHRQAAAKGIHLSHLASRPRNRRTQQHGSRGDSSHEPAARPSPTSPESPRIASEPSIQTVCEVGFNAGHSALRWLLRTKVKAWRVM